TLRYLISLSRTHTFTHLTFFFFTHPAPTEIYTLSLHDALPISAAAEGSLFWQIFLTSHVNRKPDKHANSGRGETPMPANGLAERSEEHTSELQSPYDLVCRLLLEKKKERN